MKRAALNIGVLVGFLILAYAYLYPGSQALIERRTDTMISDGTDPAPLPYAYDLVIDTWKKKPSRLFYGAVHVDTADPQYGASFWFPWNERFVIVASSYFFETEEIYGVLLVFLLVANAGAMYALARYLGWARTLSFGLALAWGFSCYTRARAKVHGSLAGIYHLPLIFLGLYLIVRGRSWRSLLLAMLSLLGAATVAHYYLVIGLFLSPLFVVFVLLQPEFRADRARIAKRFVLGVLPVVLFLGYNRFVLVPSDAKITDEKLIEIDTPAPQQVETFLRVFYAHPIDYFTGDIGLGIDSYGRPVTSDVNPLRELLNDHVINTMTAGNPHERTNGIRWIVIGLSIAALVALIRSRDSLAPDQRYGSLFFLGFGTFCFFLSLSPDFPFRETGLSYWVYTIIPKIRVASRSGIGVHFALLMMAGFYLHSLRDSKWKKFWFLPGLFPALLFLDYLPVQPMPMAPVHPRYVELGRDKGPCQQGMFFPTVNPITEQINHYTMAQRLRGSDCPNLNSMKNTQELSILLQLFPPVPQFMAAVGKEPRIDRALDRLVECVPLNWVVFHGATPGDWVKKSCDRWGWTLHPDGSCIAPDRARPMKNLPSACFR